MNDIDRRWAQRTGVITILVLIFLAWLAFGSVAWGASPGVQTTSDNIAFPVRVMDTLGRDFDPPDSFQVLVWHEDVGDNTNSYNASGNTTVGWIAGTAEFGSDTTWYFRDALADIDGGQGDGLYTGIVYSWVQGERTGTPFSFYLSAVNTNDYQDSVTNAIHADNKANFKATGFATSSDFDSVNAAIADAGKLGKAGDAADTLLAHAPHGDDWASAGSQTWNSTQRDSVLDAISDAGKLGTAGDAADTVIAHAPHADNWGGGLDSAAMDVVVAVVVNDSNLARDATKEDYKSGSGAGAQLCSLLVLDTSGADSPVANAKVSVYADGYSGSPIVVTSNSAGWATVNLDVSTAYDVIFGPTAGWKFDPYDMTTGSGGTFLDTLAGYNYSVGTAGTATLKRIYDYTEGGSYNGSIQKAGFRVVAQLHAATSSKKFVPRDTVAKFDYGWENKWETRTDTSGYWQLDVPITDYIQADTASTADSVGIVFTMYRFNSAEPRWVTRPLYFYSDTTICLSWHTLGKSCAE